MMSVNIFIWRRSMTTEEIKAYQKEYKAAHKAEAKEYHKAYEAAHKAELKAYHKAYEAAHRDEVKAYHKKYYEDNKTEALAYSEFYQRQHYCCEDISQIENYSLAKADNFIKWDIHHRLETNTLDGEKRLVDLSHSELKALDMYYNRPASELIFLKHKEHMQLHNKKI